MRDISFFFLWFPCSDSVPFARRRKQTLGNAPPAQNLPYVLGSCLNSGPPCNDSFEIPDSQHILFFKSFADDPPWGNIPHILGTSSSRLLPSALQTGGDNPDIYFQFPGDPLASLVQISSTKLLGIRNSAPAQTRVTIRGDSRQQKTDLYPKDVHGIGRWNHRRA